ncbi:MAG: valine--tRNA ligase [Patescibacteria group bacterium]
MPKTLDKTYQPKDIESAIYQKWERSGFFNPDNLPAVRGRKAKQAGLPGKRKTSFTISMPPPNVTGELHLGHATGLTIQDIMTRYHRMKGDRALYLPGTDHAGISTQVMVERLIASEGVDRHSLGRAEFLKRVWQWKKKYGSRITTQVRQLGASCDWSREHFTMDPALTAAVHKAFIALFNEGLIYRGTRIVNWCPRCATALSDLEVKHVETASKLWFIRYPLAGTTKYIVVATTRPETMLGDTAVAVNPKDKRYTQYIGQKIILPIMNRAIPIVADSRVDMAFGTGAVKVTPAHDAADYDIGLTHHLPVINVIGQGNKMTKAAGEYYGKSVQDARHDIFIRLENEELIEKTIDYVHQQARCDRCSTPIEPLISKQWFLKIAPLAKPAIAAMKSGKVTIIPKRFAKVYFHWMNNIHDWCISRQLWWGHQIPIWYCGQQIDAPKEKMGFAEAVVPQVFKGKTVTYRLRDHHLSLGDRIAFENSATDELFGIGTITGIQRVTVGTLPLEDKAHFATYVRREELVARFHKHHPHKRITNSTPAWIYTYSFTPLNTKEGCGTVLASSEQPKRCPICHRSAFLRQEEDTLDTWFSSGLWTFSTLGWPKKTKDLKLFHPTSVMETSWDILFFWVARMIMFSLKFMKQVPFRTVYIHGLVLDKDGKKMSKSKGTGIDPIPMTEKYGTDAIRLSVVLGTSAGLDYRLYEEKIAGYRNFINKLWNVARFTLSQPVSKGKLEIKTLADKWIIGRLNQLIASVTKNIEDFKFSEAGSALYDFLWHDFADWYLEISKREKNQAVLRYVLSVWLKLAHPFIPFVTEEIWSQLAPAGKNNMLIIQPWPIADKKVINNPAEKKFELLQQFIAAIRNFRSNHAIPPTEFLNITIAGEQIKLITENLEIIKTLARLSRLERQTIAKPTGSLPGLDFFIEAKVDTAKQQRDVTEISAYIQKLGEKLSNKNFTERAPKEVVEKERQKLAEAQAKLKKII